MPPNSALTRFIKRGLARSVWPLCRVAYKMDGEYIWAFFHEYSQSDSTLDRLRRSRGFCAEHAERLRRLEVDGLHSNLGISGVYLDTFQGLADELRSLRPGSGLPEPEKCPTCAYRDEEVERNARDLLEEVRDNAASRERLLASNGLCFSHFRLVWERAEEPVERELLLELQSRAARVGVPLEQVMIEGDHPAEDLLRYAHEHAFDLVVSGHHRQSRAGRFLFHGAAQRLIEAGTIPVPVVGEDEGR